MTESSQRFPLLLSLPPELLHPIFDEAQLPASSVAICKDLLPYTRQSLYYSVGLLSSRQISLFARTVLSKPEVARLCRDLVWSRKHDIAALDKIEQLAEKYAREPQEGQIRDVSGSEDALSPKEARRCVAQIRATEDEFEYEQSMFGTYPGLVPLDQDALIHLVRALVNLTSFASVGPELSTVVMSGFYDEDAATRLTTVEIHRGTATPWGSTHKDMLLNARRLPALKHLFISGGKQQIPFDAAHFTVESRNWPFQHLELDDQPSLSRSLSSLFQSLSCITYLTIQATDADYDLVSAIAALPPTLLVLTLTFPQAQHGMPSFLLTPSNFPKLNNLGRQFPQLVHLRLSGPIFDSQPFFASLRNSGLRCLQLGHDAPLVFEDIHKILQGPTKLSDLKHLTIDICFCPPIVGFFGFAVVSSLTVGKPNWPKHLSFKQAEIISDACDDAGVELLGSILCALKKCERLGEHNCGRANEVEAV